jgi:hypothetical protein
LRYYYIDKKTLYKVSQKNKMPMCSKAQRAYLWIHHPEIAKEFESKTPKGKKLPKRVKK